MSRHRRVAIKVPALSTANLVEAKQQEKPPPPLAKSRQLSYEQLHKATASFSPMYKLGQGQFWPIFRGTLSNGREVAVTVIDDSSFQSEHKFRNELSLTTTLIAAPEDASWHVVFPIVLCSDDDEGGGFNCHYKKKRRKKKKQWGVEEEDKCGI